MKRPFILDIVLEAQGFLTSLAEDVLCLILVHPPLSCRHVDFDWEPLRLPLVIEDSMEHFPFVDYLPMVFHYG